MVVIVSCLPFGPGAKRRQLRAGGAGPSRCRSVRQSSGPGGGGVVALTPHLARGEEKRSSAAPSFPSPPPPSLGGSKPRERAASTSFGKSASKQGLLAPAPPARLFRVAHPPHCRLQSGAAEVHARFSPALESGRHSGKKGGGCRIRPSRRPNGGSRRRTTRRRRPASRRRHKESHAVSPRSGVGTGGRALWLPPVASCRGG